MEKVLIVDDDLEFLSSLSRVLKGEFSILSASSIAEARKSLGEDISLVLLDIRMKDSDVNNREGIDFLKEIKSNYPKITVVMMTAYGDIDTAVETMKLGAEDFIQKGKIDIREYRKVINGVLEKSRLERRIDILEEELRKAEPWEIVGNDPVILKVKEMIEMVAESPDTTVLIRGETGTGKELVARAIHKKGKRRDGPFIPVSLSALSKTLIESELFGHERGAFTGADRRRIGYLEKANGGVLFLDEIGDLEPETQLKLLRFLDYKSFCRVGSTEEITVDVQFLAATNRDLEKAMGEGKFREDLYYRLKAFQIFLPPLRERKGDIPLLAEHFLKLSGKGRCERISKEALAYLMNYHWPGNVRELKSSIERAIIFANYRNHREIMPEDLPLEVRTGKVEDKVNLGFEIPEDGLDIKEELAKLELSYIESALKKCEGKKTEAWKILGYNDRFALHRRVKKILAQFPNLTDKFPYIKMKYAKPKNNTF